MSREPGLQLGAQPTHHGDIALFQTPLHPVHRAQYGGVFVGMAGAGRKVGLGHGGVLVREVLFGVRGERFQCRGQVGVGGLLQGVDQLGEQRVLTVHRGMAHQQLCLP